jgi:hypothetical protein
MDNGVPLQLIPDEIQEQDLLDHHPDDHMEEDHLEVVDAQHLGFVQLFEPDGDPVFIERAQAVFFTKSRSNSCVGQMPCSWAWGQLNSDPKAWADFFTLLLVSPETHSWAKKLLSSQAWNVFVKHSEPQLIPFCLPPSCPDLLKDLCPKSLPSVVGSPSSDSATPASANLISSASAEAQSSEQITEGVFSSPITPLIS